MAKEAPKMEIIVSPNMEKIDEFIKKGVQGKNNIERKTEVILAETGKVEKVDKYSLQRTRGYLRRIKDHIKDIERVRKTIKEPVLKTASAIDGQAKIYKKELEEKAAGFTREINNYKAAEEKRKEEEFARIEGLSWKLRQSKSIADLQTSMQALEPADRKKKRVIEAFKYTQEKIEEAAKLEKMKKEQEAIQAKKEKQERQEIDKLHLMTTLEEVQHFEDYIKNMYEEIPGKIQAAIFEKRAKLNQEQNEGEEKASQTDKKQAVRAPRTQNEVNIPEKQKKEEREEKKELSNLEKFEFILEQMGYDGIVGIGDKRMIQYVEDIRKVLL